MSLYLDEKDVIVELRNRGYRITKEDYSCTSSISNVRQVVDWFYARRLYYNSDRKYPPSGVSYTADSKILSVFIRQRQKLGLGKKAALQEAAMLIDNMFKFEQHLGLKEPIMSIGILTQSSIMNRICAYANGEVPLVEEEKDHQLIDAINRVYNRENAEKDLHLASKRMDEMLENLNGKK